MNQVIVERIAGRRLQVRAGGAVAIIDREVDAGGAGDGFRSVDLLMGALGSCSIGTMLAYAEKEGIAVGDVRAELKPVSSLGTNAVTRAELVLQVGGDVSEEDLERLEAAAAQCKVHRSLHEGIETRLTLTMLA